MRKVIDDNAGLTENFLAHQLPDLTGAVVMPVAVLVLIFVFDWRLGLCCLVPLAISVFFLKQMMGGDNAHFMEGYMTALETMNKEAVEYIRGIPVVKVFQQTVYSFKNFHAAIEEYGKYASISFENVSFSYPGTEEKSLDQFSFELPAGKTVALVGASGSGKSTAAKLIPRFYDASEGSVLVGGVNVKNISKEALMSEIAFVFQNTKLFKDTLLGNGGTYLSGGENQRIALARAILKDAPIIVLDEATASLDVDNETEIQEAISCLVKGKTVLVIAHRMRTVENADQIIVLDGGVVREKGTHAELMRKNGLYARLVKLQTEASEWKRKAGCCRQAK